ncbi:Glutathione S-transferase [Bordetella muralis]|jgi:glutathione S-transferase
MSDWRTIPSTNGNLNMPYRSKGEQHAMKLYYMPGACSLAAHIVLEWIGKPYETQAIARDALKQPEFLSINPMGAVPVLTDGGYTLTQNASILEYLAEQAPQLNLLGDGTAQSRAEARRWLGFINSDLHRTFSLVFGPQRFVASEAAQKELSTSAAAILRNLFTILNTQLADKPYLAGKAPTIADPYLYVVLRWAKAKNIDLSGLNNLTEFSSRMDADKGVQAALKAEGL